MGTDQSAAEVGVQVLAAASKWGRVAADEGATFLPNSLLTHQQALNLSSTELVVLVHVLRYWQADGPAAPLLPAIAQAMDLGPASVGRCLVALQDLGLLRALGDGTFDVRPLVERLQALNAQASA